MGNVHLPKCVLGQWEHVRLLLALTALFHSHTLFFFRRTRTPNSVVNRVNALRPEHSCQPPSLLSYLDRSKTRREQEATGGRT
jgi:hypothetical protein